MPSEMAIWSDQDEPQLFSGDRMSRPEFHALYENAPDDFEAELIGGTVYVRPPRTAEHDEMHRILSAILLTYQLSTDGIEVCENATVILEADSEPQPDLLVRRLDDFGGTSMLWPDGYIQGPPELVIEIARSNRSIELHAKLNDYRRYGVGEYLVYVIEEKSFRLFSLHTTAEPAPDSTLISSSAQAPDPDGILKIHHFPGLWIDQTAVLSNNRVRMIATLQRGIASTQHSDSPTDNDATLRPGSLTAPPAQVE